MSLRIPSLFHPAAAASQIELVSLPFNLKIKLPNFFFFFFVLFSLFAFSLIWSPSEGAMGNKRRWSPVEVTSSGVVTSCPLHCNPNLLDKLFPFVH